MKSKYIIYEVLFNKRQKLVVSINKEDLLQDYKNYVKVKESIGLNTVKLRTYVLCRIQRIIATSFIEI